MKQLILLLMFISLTTHATETELIYGPVKTGDMLWNIAGSVNADSHFSRYQVMMALLAVNPDAFKIPCNINSLQVGKMLRVPNAIEIRQLTATQAIELFEQHKAIWQQSRQSGQAIVCPEEVKQHDDIPTRSLLNEPTLSEASTFPDISNTNLSIAEQLETLPSEKKQAVETIIAQPVVIKSIPITKKQNITPFSFVDQIKSEIGTLVAQPLATIPVSIIIFALAILCFILLVMFSVISWMLKYLFNVKHNQIPLEKQEPILQTNLTVSSLNDEPNINSSVDDVKEKLVIIRSYLADGEEATLHHLLQTVMQKGTIEQQAEARQLIEINRKMQSLQQKNVTNRTALAEILQTKHLHDNSTHLSDIVDKVFSLLDKELEAGGKLIETYQNRQNTTLVVTDTYQVTDVQEKVIQETDETSQLPPKARDKPTRYL